MYGRGGQAEHESWRVDGRGRYGNEGRQWPEYRDESMREEGLQARGAYKEVPRASRSLALATPLGRAPM